MESLTPTPLVIDALRSHREALRVELADRMRSKEHAEKTVRGATELLVNAERLLASNVEAEQQTRQKLQEVQDLLNKHAPDPIAVFVADEQSSNNEEKIAGQAAREAVTNAAVELLAGGKKVTPGQVFFHLNKLGIKLDVQRPIARISQILHQDDRFMHDRNSGWLLKGESPGGTGLSGATKSLAGQTTSES